MASAPLVFPLVVFWSPWLPLDVFWVVMMVVASLRMFLIVVAMDCSLLSHRFGSHAGLGDLLRGVGFGGLSECFE